MIKHKNWKIKIALITAIIILIITVISYLNYRLTPMKIFHLAPKQLWSVLINRSQLRSGEYVNPPIYDTSIIKSYVIEGYLSNDPVEIKKAILTYLKVNSDVDIHSKTLQYEFVFYKAKGKVNRNFYIEDYENSDLNDYKVASVNIAFGNLPTITYYHIGHLAFNEYSINDSTIVREKFKDGVVIREDRYLPNGKIVHKDLSHEWDSIMKDKDK